MKREKSVAKDGITKAIGVASQAICIVAPSVQLPKKVVSDEQMQDVVRIAQAAKAMLKDLEQRKLEYITPIKKGLLKLESDLRASRRPLEYTHKAAKDLVADYIMRKNAQAIKKVQKRVEKTPTVKNKEALKIAKQATHVGTPAGISVTKESWSYEVTDETAVPAYTCLPDGNTIELRTLKHSALLSLAKLGDKAPCIPGIVWKKQVKVSI